MKRRDILQTIGGWAAATTLAQQKTYAAEETVSRGEGMGVSIASYGFRNRPREGGESSHPWFRTALDVLDHCHRKLRAGGVQVGVRGWQADFSRRVRDRRESYGMYLEGQIRLPGGKEDRGRFEAEVVTAKEAGASILRTVALSGRRYETFDSEEAFEVFRKKSWEALVEAERIVARHRVSLAVENHKDWRVPELLAILERLGSEYIGVCLDTGNSISLLEDPMEVAEAYAPYAVTTHLKDMAVLRYEDGFLLSEVPLGSGFLDLKKIVAVCRRHRPGIAFNLEMITRDPLKIPCLTPKYWATMAGVRARDLAVALARVRHVASKSPLPSVSGLTDDERLKAEEENVVQSFRFFRSALGM